MNMVVAKNTIGQNFQHYRIDYLKYAIDWQLQHYWDVVNKKLHYKMGDCVICYAEKDIFSTITSDAVFNLFKAMKDRKGTL